jgi:hypothetical protein
LCYALDYGRYVEEVPLQWQNVSFWPPEWLQVILGWKDNETARKRHETCTLWPKINGNLIRCHLQGFGQNPENCPRCRKSCAIAHENGPKRTFSRSHKIQNRLTRRPTRWCYALNYGGYVEEGPLQWRNVWFLPPEWLQVIVCWKGNEMARKRHWTCTLWPKTQWKPHKMSSTRIW